MINAKVKQKFLEDRIRKESQPKYFVGQKIQFPIYEFDLTGEVYPDKVLKNIEILTAGDNNKPDLVTNGYQSPYYDKNKINLFDDLIDAVEKRTSIIGRRKFYVKNFWFVVLKSSGAQKLHSHSSTDEFFHDSIFSGVYYPLGTNNTPLIFLNENKELIIEAKPNQFILFDGRLKHRVPEVLNSNNRVSVAFNFLI